MNAESAAPRLLNRSRPALRASVVWFLFCALLGSDTGGLGILEFVVLVYVSAAWVLVWFVRLVWALIRRRWYGKSSLRYWLFEPVFIAACLAVSYFGVLRYPRFVLSEAALSRYVEEVRAGKVDLSLKFKQPSRLVGLYWVSRTELAPDGTVRMLTSGYNLLDDAGFANSPSNPPPYRGDDSYQHIDRHWWFWYQSW